MNEKIPLILAAMEPNGWSLNDLAIALQAKGLQVEKSTVENWVYKGTKKISQYAYPITEVTNADYAWFVDETKGGPVKWRQVPSQRDLVTVVNETRAEYAPFSLARGDMIHLALWRGIAASNNDQCYFIEPDSPEFMEIPAFLVPGNNIDRYVVCTAAGASMSPRIRQGYRIVVYLNPNPAINDLVICESGEDRHKVVKILREVKNRLELHSIHPDHQPITNLEGWTFVGSVTAILGDYEAGQANIEYNYGRPLKG